MSNIVKDSSMGFSVTLHASFAEAMAKVTEALKNEGFGVLTTVDIQATMKAKLNAEYPSFTILGVCNPHLAHRALTEDPHISLMLPCNVVVRQVAEGALIEFADPEVMMTISNDEALRQVAAEAKAKLERAAAAL